MSLWHPRGDDCHADRYAYRMAQLVTRVEDAMVDAIDALVVEGVASSRSEVVRMGLERLIDEHRRRAVGAEIVAAYRRTPETPVEAAGLDAATRALIEEEPW